MMCPIGGFATLVVPSLLLFSALKISQPCICPCICQQAACCHSNGCHVFSGRAVPFLFRARTWVRGRRRLLSLPSTSGSPSLAAQSCPVLRSQARSAVQQRPHHASPSYPALRCAAQVLAQIIRAAQLPVVPTLRMEDNLTNYEDCLGGCERILRTPIPLYYTRHTSRFMMIWLTLLPFALWPTCAWGTVPLSGIIAFLLLGECRKAPRGVPDGCA